MQGFKSAMLRGGRDLGIREVLGITLSLVSTVVIFRQVGPEAYGLVGIGIGLSTLSVSVGSLGLNVFVIRRGRLSEDEAGQVMSILLLSAVVLFGTLWFAVPLVELWTDAEGLAALVRVVGGAVAVKLAGLTPMSLLERDLRFGTAATIDFAGLIVYYAVAIPLVFLGWGALGIWTGNLVQGLAATIGYLALRPVRPRRLERPLVLESLRYGIGYQGSVWVYSLRDLAAPFLLPRLAGIDALGLVTAGTQIVSRLGFFKTVVWRLSISGFSKLQDDARALARSISEGMVFQVVLLGGGLALFASVGSWLIPLAFSDQWSEVAKVFPLLAMTALVNGVFTLHTSALFARGRIWSATKFHLVLVALLWFASLALIPVWGLWGYLVAEVVAMASYVYLAFLTEAEIGRIDYRPMLKSLVVVAVPLLAGPWLSPWAAIALWLAAAAFALASMAHVRTVLRESLEVLRRA